MPGLVFEYMQDMLGSYNVLTTPFPPPPSLPPSRSPRDVAGRLLLRGGSLGR